MNSKENFMDYVGKLPQILLETGMAATIPKAHTQYIEQSLISPDKHIETSISTNLSLAASSLESFACDLYLHGEISQAEERFDEAFICRRDYLFIKKISDTEQLFFLAVSALGAKRASELRLTLNEHEINNIITGLDWPELVSFNIMCAFLFLSRKRNGWEDVTHALKAIDNLKDLQKQFEEDHLKAIQDFSVFDKVADVGRLISLYNLAKIVEIAGTYLINGEPGNPTIKIQRHYDNAIEALGVSGEYVFERFADMVFIGCDILIKNSIWYNTRTLGQQVRDLVKELADAKRENPFIELWPSQQDAIRSSLFDTAKRAIVLQMPTSAGKTLMAEFAIVQSHALNPQSTVVYIVPTRALVNQVTLQLRKDLTPLKLVIEAAVPVFELDPTESELLKKQCNVLVSTPEKIELLIRANHPIVKEISLLVVDEAHNLSDSTRGSTLELFLGTVLREKPHARFLLMSPFIPNADEIGSWIGNELNAPIRVDWKPSERITAAVSISGTKSQKFLELLTLQSAHNSDVKEELKIPIKSIIVGKSVTKTNIALSAAISLMEKGGVLLLCSGREGAVKRAKELLKYLPEIKQSTLLTATIDYLKDELGENHILISMLNRGIAFHHAGLSQESRYLIERLVEQGQIKIVCATTTLAQGVNFPIRTVVVEGITRPTEKTGHQQIPYNEFWNIAGRAGRAMKDHMGLIVFAARNTQDIDTYKEYLKHDARNIVSSILTDLSNISDIACKYDRKFVFDHPALARFFQYLLHAISVSDYQTIFSEMEEVLRSSLIYHQVNKDNPEIARKLVQLARSYLELIKGKAENRGILKLVDGTGFSSISVDVLFALRTDFTDVRVWDNKSLFSQTDSTLTKMINVLAEIPELDLTRLGRGTLNTDSIARIIKEWVGGVSIEEIADKYFASVKDKDERILNTSRYIHQKLVGQLAWGMSALQKVSLFGQQSVNWEEVGHVPALMYYGVSSKDAVTLRMTGVPRNSAEKLAAGYKKKFTDKSPTFQEIRNWLAETNDSDWKDESRKSKMSGGGSKFIWKVLNGIS